MGGKAMTYQFSIYSRAEAMYLLQLAREHRDQVSLRCRETNFFTEITLQPDFPELQEYFDYMLRRFREEQRQMEALYRRSPSTEERKGTETWQHHVLL